MGSMWGTPRHDVLQRLLGRLCALLLSAVGALAQSPPRVPGLLGPHPLGEEETGELLFAELGCANCYTGTSPTQPTAPRLDEVGQRAEPGYLAHFIANPSGPQPGTRMPDVLGHLPPA